MLPRVKSLGPVIVNSELVAETTSVTTRPLVSKLTPPTERLAVMVMFRLWTSPPESTSPVVSPPPKSTPIVWVAPPISAPRLASPVTVNWSGVLPEAGA